MRLSIFTASVVLTCLLSSPVRAQSSATLDISDVDLFYRLYDATDGRPTAEQIQSGYIDVGSPGLRTFFDARRTTAVRVAEASGHCTRTLLGAGIEHASSTRRLRGIEGLVFVYGAIGHA
ncbi:MULTISPECIES: hypothetical protein [unclassified Brevundimonas]|uniref:hypothetical protein n=1 Tax=unclassified Brevundimonas TaxID=2622653 RepID=UPI000CFAF90B|nr:MULTISPECIES: hypothetical protein [unclassified Brevundimonas]PRA28537.1 hypothetical protein CQ024_09840 [Brevundimonas sp. MYb27]PQZ84060.1 hypothetical protein CQ026_01955 [Brevundimonas sp. MYb31]PRB17967.1 hypothetical protein CQ039_02845 [Brevundimonas sp. MYb52]PRB35947.1 hypothetical protein CQ035_06620 [Brevundimonas sp. MYb46]PRB55881.1 hypothetical protein CQ028_00090 [Brevundimonas sp. MYb33]